MTRPHPLSRIWLERDQVGDLISALGMEPAAHSPLAGVGRGGTSRPAVDLAPLRVVLAVLARPAVRLSVTERSPGGTLTARYFGTRVGTFAGCDVRPDGVTISPVVSASVIAETHAAVLASPGVESDPKALTFELTPLANGGGSRYEAFVRGAGPVHRFSFGEAVPRISSPSVEEVAAVVAQACRESLSTRPPEVAAL